MRFDNAFDGVSVPAARLADKDLVSPFVAPREVGEFRAGGVARFIVISIVIHEIIFRAVSRERKISVEIVEIGILYGLRRIFCRKLERSGFIQIDELHADKLHFIPHAGNEIVSEQYAAGTVNTQNKIARADFGHIHVADVADFHNLKASVFLQRAQDFRTEFVLLGLRSPFAVIVNRFAFVSSAVYLIDSDTYGLIRNHVAGACAVYFHRTGIVGEIYVFLQCRADFRRLPLRIVFRQRNDQPVDGNIRISASVFFAEHISVSGIFKRIFISVFPYGRVRIKPFCGVHDAAGISLRIRAERIDLQNTPGRLAFANLPRIRGIDHVRRSVQGKRGVRRKNFLGTEGRQHPRTGSRQHDGKQQQHHFSFYRLHDSLLILIISRSVSNIRAHGCTAFPTL